jgi:hypothetical protein
MSASITPSFVPPAPLPAARRGKLGPGGTTASRVDNHSLSGPSCCPEWGDGEPEGGAQAAA